MALNINPLAKLVTNVSQGIQTAITEAKAVGDAVANDIKKQQLDQKISRLSGEIGSGFNQATAAAQGAGFDGKFANGALNSVAAAGQVATGMGNVISSPVGGGALSNAADTINSLQSAASTAAGVANSAADISSAVSKLSAGSLGTGIQNIAGQISKTAGVLNNLLSLKRGANIPAGGEMFKQSGSGIPVQPTPADDWRVRINLKDWSVFSSSLFQVLESTGGVVFPILPTVNLATKANYTQIDPTHNNYPFQAYKNSQVDEISISGPFPVEDEVQAHYWLASTVFFRTVTKMFFGTGQNAGNPPIVCLLSGYGGGVFNNVPVVVKSFSVDFPTDVNYIKCNLMDASKPTWVPVKSDISITVQPLYNRRNLRQFSLESFANGNMVTPTNQGYL